MSTLSRGNNFESLIKSLPLRLSGGLLYYGILLRNYLNVVNLVQLLAFTGYGNPRFQ